MAGMILSWDGGLSRVAFGNSLALAGILVYGLCQKADMRVFMRKTRDKSQALQGALLLGAQHRGGCNVWAYIFASCAQAVTLKYFRTYGAFDARSTGPLPTSKDIWEGHEWFHLIALMVHAVHLASIHQAEASLYQRCQ
mmetsp:Transcript_117248/g.184425  ORF Transcript_117248/g.184425 Transcript_117248/m.184425 type:complete len:139 (+) Transcript_117248:129-545(+)